MPTKELPKKLVRRLRTAVEHGETRPSDWPDPVERFLVSLDKVDPRPTMSFGGVEGTTGVGQRIRQLDVHRSHPEIGHVALKHVHTYDASQTIAALQDAVQRHNRSYHSENYDLLMPHASPLRDNLLAMSKAEFEVDGMPVKALEGMPVRDLTALAHGPKTVLEVQKTREVLEQHGFGKERLEAISKELVGRVMLEGVQDAHKKLEATNILVVGVRNRRLQLVPAIDIF